ncbi:MAG: alanine racemase [Alphaproteobacteria bacterium]|jgi:alanine racemase|nr:alanine racemase [Alphaproteobacteria bacterium]
MYLNSFFDATLYVNLQAVQKNYLTLQQKSFPAKCAATIKANAYGLGVNSILNSLYEVGCRDFFTATLGEAIYLRKIKEDINIYIFHGLKENECDEFFKHNLTPILNSIDEIKIWQNYAKKKRLILSANIHFDTGINRLGLNFEDLKLFKSNKIKYDQIKIEYIMSHLACSNEHDNPRNQLQLEQVLELKEVFPKQKFNLANSSAIFLDKKYHFDMVRPGAALFGINPTPYLKENPMDQVVTLTTKVIHIREVKQNGMVGYGNICPIKKGMRLATIPIGYADGYLRSLTNRGYCYLKGNIIPTLGKISMDMTIIDISNFNKNEIKIGDEVEIIGKNIDLSELAKQAGTISYEILTSFSGRFKKVYVAYQG